MLKKITSFYRLKYSATKLYTSKLGVGGTLLYIFRRLTKPKGRLIQVCLLSGAKVYLRSKTNDINIFSQIFIYEELNFNLQKVPAVIIDCGANIGLSTVYLKYKYPRAKVVSVEPESSNFEMLTKNTAIFSDVFLEKKGIWNRSTMLYITDEGEGADSYKVFEIRPAAKVIGEVSAISINDIIAKYNLHSIDLLKMDIEGTEYTLFQSKVFSWINQVNCLAVEIHEQMNPGCKLLIDNSMKGFQYQSRGEYHIYTQP